MAPATPSVAAITTGAMTLGRRKRQRNIGEPPDDFVGPLATIPGDQAEYDTGRERKPLRRRPDDE